jgi:hypothetical protein
VIPAEHVLGLVGLQEAAAGKVAEHPPPGRVLEAFQELVGEEGGFVEAEPGFREGRGRILIDALEKSVHYPEVEMVLGIEAGAETMEEGPETGTARSVVWHGEDPLADGQVGNDAVHQVSRGLGHALGVTGGAGTPALAGKRHQEVVTAGGAPDPCKPVGQDPALQIAPELLSHVIWHAVAHGIGLGGQGEVGLQVFTDDAVERGGLGTATAIGLGMGAGRWPGWWCGPPGFPVCGADLYGHP